MTITEIIRLSKKHATEKLRALGFDIFKNDMYLKDSFVASHHITIMGDKKNTLDLDLSEFEYDLEGERYVLIQDRVKIIIHD